MLIKSGVRCTNFTLKGIIFTLPDLGMLGSCWVRELGLFDGLADGFAGLTGLAAFSGITGLTDLVFSSVSTCGNCAALPAAALAVDVVGVVAG